MIKRFNYLGDMQQHRDGDFVTYEDHAAEVARLNEQVRALAADNATLRNLQPTELMVASAHAEAEEYDNLNLDDDLIVFMWQAMHSVIKTPATNAILNEVGARAVEGFVTYCGKENSVFVETKAYYRSLEDAVGEYAASIRAGEVQP